MLFGGPTDSMDHDRVGSFPNVPIRPLRTRADRADAPVTRPADTTLNLYMFRTRL